MTEAQRRRGVVEPIRAHVLVVEARFYDAIADDLLAGAVGHLDAAGASHEVVTVPGALELPLAIALLVDAAAAKGAPYDAVVALGCVIRGETTHYEIVSEQSARGLMDLSVALRLPIANGVLTVETEAQAFARARVAEMDKGGFAAETALALLRLKRRAEG
jgi:6,7-dimethyl-8-ribityllumazine synthase